MTSSFHGSFIFELTNKILCSASIEGRVYVWKISEGPDEEEKQQISGNIVLALHITGDEESVHPRVCWHCHKQVIIIYKSYTFYVISFQEI